MPQAILFDCDGVLIDSRDAYCFYFNRLRKSVGLGPMDCEQQDFMFMHSVEEAINHIIPVALQSVALDGSNWLSMSEFCAHVRVMPGIDEFLDFLHYQGVAVAVNTNSRSEVHEILKRTGLARHFKLVMTASDVQDPKPAPAGARKILRYLQLEPDQVAFVGDSQVDQQTAQALGVAFWAYRNPRLDADLHFSDYTEVLQMMAGEGSLPIAA